MDYYYYYFPQPPYILVIVGIFIGITCGSAFEASLKQQLQKGYKYVSLKSLAIRLPFWGICAGVCLFLASGLEIFSILPWVAYLIALPITVFVGGLIWKELGKVLTQLEEGGSKAIDLDAYE